MLKVGNKIRKIRELKNIASKDMADKLGMTVQGYAKIERDDTSLNMERLEQISSLFEMKPEDVLSFDEKNVLNIYGEIKGGNQLNNGIINSFPEEMKQLYEDKIKLLEEKIKWLEKSNASK